MACMQPLSRQKRHMQQSDRPATVSAAWGTLDYYIARLASPTPPIHVDVCDPALTDDDVLRLAEALTSPHNSGRGGASLKKLRLRGSQITSRGFLALAEAIVGAEGSRAALEELDLGHTCRITDDTDDFAFGIFLLLSEAKHLKRVNLEGSCVGRQEQRALEEVFASEKEALKLLHLEC